MDIPDRLSCRRAIEALRNGVPNREAVRIQGSTQPHAEQRFQELLDQAADGGADGTVAQTGRGMLISGDFGTGKSHLLEHFEHIALDRNFICSRVAVSKETPFYDLGKMFRAATDNGTTPGGTVGIMVDEIGTRLAGSQSAGYARFFTWANEADHGLHRIFPATLLVHERLPDQEVCNEIRWFWSGDKLAVSTVKNGLRQLQQQGAYTFKAPKLKDLPPQRLRFVLEMTKAAGYRGWVVLIDEMELIGSYSVLQRARSYAELARWMGDTGEDYPGLVVVAAITEDFAEAILEEKGDRIKVPDRMRGRGDEQIAQQGGDGNAVDRRSSDPAARSDAGGSGSCGRHDQANLPRCLRLGRTASDHARGSRLPAQDALQGAFSDYRMGLAATSSRLPPPSWKATSIAPPTPKTPILRSKRRTTNQPPDRSIEVQRQATRNGSSAGTAVMWSPIV